MQQMAALLSGGMGGAPRPGTPCRWPQQNGIMAGQDTPRPEEMEEAVREGAAAASRYRTEVSRATPAPARGAGHHPAPKKHPRGHSAPGRLHGPAAARKQVSPALARRSWELRPRCRGVACCAATDGASGFHRLQCDAVLWATSSVLWAACGAEAPLD